MVTLEVDLPVLNAVNNTGAPGPSQWHIETTPEALALFTTFEAGLRGLAALKGIEVPANHFSSNLLENNIAVDNTTLFVVSGCKCVLVYAQVRSPSLTLAMYVLTDSICAALGGPSISALLFLLRVRMS